MTVSKEFDSEEVEAEILPTQKLERVKALIAEGRKVAMIGDGINNECSLVLTLYLESSTKGVRNFRFNSFRVTQLG